jgi:hypothetical protein
VARAINLLGVFLGRAGDLGSANEDNPEGYWERPDITRLNDRLLGVFGRKWNSVAPLPDGWNRSGEVKPFRDEIKALVSTEFKGQSLWGWKDPRTCLVFQLWREVLEELGVELSCVYVVRGPLDVAHSLKRRDAMRLGQAFGLWFNYNLAALEGCRGVPIAFLGYDHLLESWEPELRRVTDSLAIPWPAETNAFRDAMKKFIRPGLRHSQSSTSDLQGTPLPVRELNEALFGTLDAQGALDSLFATAERLTREFRSYASFFDSGLDNAAIVQAPRPHYVQRTWWRWKRSIRKRLPFGKPQSLNPSPGLSSK